LLYVFVLLSFSIEDELTIGELIMVFVAELVGGVEEMVELTKETKRRASSSLSISSH